MRNFSIGIINLLHLLRIVHYILHMHNNIIDVLLLCKYLQQGAAGADPRLTVGGCLERSASGVSDYNA